MKQQKKIFYFLFFKIPHQLTSFYKILNFCFRQIKSYVFQIQPFMIQLRYIILFLRLNYKCLHTLFMSVRSILRTTHFPADNRR